MDEHTFPHPRKPPRDLFDRITDWIEIILTVICFVVWLVNTFTGPKHPALVDAPRPAIERPAPAKPAPAPPAPPASIRD